jgi:2-amino-4-hydroxy-6-hydroxymethyldihydropteridine diphosphokinase
MSHVAFSLGTNIGDRVAHLDYAIHRLGSTEGISVISISQFYETEPVGGPEQDNYLNAIVTGESDLSPRELLNLCHDIEAGRDRKREVRWGPRTLDIDLLVVGDVVSDDPVLTIPHPRAHVRGFVLTPWATIDPNCVIPAQGRVIELAQEIGSDGVWLSELQSNGDPDAT